jgi:quinol monooxygenase YgiN
MLVLIVLLGLFVAVPSFSLRNQSLLRLRSSSSKLYLTMDGLPATKRFCVSVTISVKPERREEFMACIAKNAAGTKQEPLNVLYTWGESVTTPNLFHFQEQFLGKAGFEAHTKAEHFKEWEVFANNPDSPFTEPPQVIQFEMLGGH